MKNSRKIFFESARRIVVKVGSGVLTEDNGLHVAALTNISAQISHLMDDGCEVLLVSSGAMASGLKKIGLSKRPDEIPKRQAVAAVGQAGLMNEYEKAFGRHQKKVAQILLTHADLSNRVRYLNARNTLNTLLSWQIVPIINENDTVMVEEIKFGDNDNLSAMIAILMGADILINLTDIDGLYDKDPRRHPDAKAIPVVSTINRDIETLAGGIPGPLGTGGMLSKIKAAKKVTTAGIPMVIAHGRRPDTLTALFSGEEAGTFFVPKKKKLQSRKCWIGLTLKPEGAVVIDDGAVNAIVNGGKSLLPGGITSVNGEFGTGASIEVIDKNGSVIGTGLVNYSSEEIGKIKGLKTSGIKSVLGSKPYDEVIHRDNLAVTGVCEV